MPKRLGLFRFLVCLIIPGGAFFILGRRVLGAAVGGLYLGAAALTVLRLGYFAGEFGFGMIISIHATSICYLETQWLKESPFRTRLALAVCTLLAVWGLAYLPLMSFAEAHWVMPMRRGHQVMIVKRRVPASSLKRGDWVAFEIQGNRFSVSREDAVILDSGLCLDKVLALPGDTVQFSNSTFFVNGVAMSAPPHMPRAGDFIVPEKTWFIWPNLAIYRNHGARGEVAGTIQEASMVAEKQMIGRVFESWCGRRQIP